MGLGLGEFTGVGFRAKEPRQRKLKYLVEIRGKTKSKYRGSRNIRTP